LIRERVNLLSTARKKTLGLGTNEFRAARNCSWFSPPPGELALVFQGFAGRILWLHIGFLRGEPAHARLGKTLGATGFLLTPGLAKGAAAQVILMARSQPVFGMGRRKRTDAHRQSGSTSHSGDNCYPPRFIEDGSPPASPHDMVSPTLRKIRELSEQVLVVCANAF
jgi:hypothetical protein